MAPQYELVVTIAVKKTIIILLNSCKTQDTFVLHNLQNNKDIEMQTKTMKIKHLPFTLDVKTLSQSMGFFILLSFHPPAIPHHTCVDSIDKYYKLNENTTSECLKQFLCTIIVFVWPMYLKELIQANIEQ